MKPTLLATLLLLGLFASPAKADDSSYLAAVSGMFHSVYGNDAMLHWGHGICDDMRGGKTVDQEIAAAPPTMALGMDVAGVVRTAQHELCPTLGH